MPHDPIPTARSVSAEPSYARRGDPLADPMAGARAMPPGAAALREPDPTGAVMAAAMLHEELLRVRELLGDLCGDLGPVLDSGRALPGDVERAAPVAGCELAAQLLGSRSLAVDLGDRIAEIRGRLAL